MASCQPPISIFIATTVKKRPHQRDLGSAGVF
jgi:hypothetical protein